jgi:hypothetical protein
LSDKALKNSQIDSYLQVQLQTNIDFYDFLATASDRREIRKWIMEGSYEEDQPSCRAASHFHNPLKNWENAQLTDPIWIVDLYCDLFSPFKEPFSNLIWATGLKNKTDEFESPVNDDPSQDHGRNWNVARIFFYQALTSGENALREEKLAQTFYTLGYVMHLLQDAAVPAHTRNDFSQGHSQAVGCPEGGCEKFTSWIGNPFEAYVRDNWRKIEQSIPIINKPYTGKLTLTNFWDTTDTNQEGMTLQNFDGQDLGLAEYSNLNFVSHATIFKNPANDAVHGFKYPSRDSIADKNYPDQVNEKLYYNIKAKDGNIDTGVYVKKEAGEGHEIDNFLSMRYAMYGSETPRWDLKFKLDDVCFKEYATHLVPRAVGYSSGLLDYFFRGRILLFDKKLEYGANGSIIGMEMQIKNGTPPIDSESQTEPFVTGDIELVYGFIPPGESIPVYHNVGSVYNITHETDLINSEYVSISASFLSNPVPKGSRGLTIALIYTGQLGEKKVPADESKGKVAMAAKVHKFEDSRIAYFYQPGGPANVSNIYTVWPDGSEQYEVTNAETPNP